MKFKYLNIFGGTIVANSMSGYNPVEGFYS